MNRIPHPDYINPNPKPVSEVELKRILKELHEKQEVDRHEQRRALNEALASGIRTGPARR